MPWTAIKTFTLFLFISIQGIAAPPIKQLTPEQQQFIEAEMLRLVNQFRGKYKKTPLLQIDSDLSKAAKLQAEFCANKNKTTHIQTGNPNYSSVTKRVSMVKNGTPKRDYGCGENAAYTDIDLEEIDEQMLKEIALELFELWGNSAGHRENMLYKDYNYFGFSVVIRPDLERIYAIQVFSFRN